MIKFSKAEIKDGKIEIVETKEIDSSVIRKCPHFILDMSHYNEDQSCKCWDKNEVIMKEWGYKWNKVKGMWV